MIDELKQWEADMVSDRATAQDVVAAIKVLDARRENEKVSTDQTVKQDAGKLELTLAPREILRAITRARMYGIKKYGDPDNWRKVAAQRFRDAAYRHWIAYLDDPYGVDSESDLKHLDHVAVNIAFLCELEKDMISNPSGGVDMK